jgi:4-amino-4-deoxy-L-arabinose transferase-like glycosyltransferase
MHGPDSRGIQAGTRGWSRADTVALALILAFGAASLVWLVHPWFDPLNDAAIYLLTAKSLAAGEGYSYLGTPFIARPPGFSVMIAPLLRSHDMDFLAVNRFVSAWGVLATILLFLVSRERLGAVLAAAFVLLLGLNPAWRATCNQAMSDVPGAAILLACLMLEARWRRAPSTAHDGMLGFAIGLAAYVRFGLVLLLPAILAQRTIAWWRAGARGEARDPHLLARLAVPTVVVALTLLPWQVRNARSRTDAPADQISHYSYSTAMWHTDPGDPGSPRCSVSELLARIPKRGLQALATYGGRIWRISRSTAEILLGGIALAIGLAVLLRENRTEGWFVAGTLALILVYFDFQRRLVLPLLILAGPPLLEAVVRAGRFLAGRRIGGAAMQALVAVPVLALAATDYVHQHKWKNMRADHRALQETCRELSAHLPPDARLAAPFGSWRYAVFLEQPVYTLYFAWARSGDMSGPEALLDKYGIDRVLISSHPQDSKFKAYFEGRYRIESRVRDVEVVRVR